MENLEEKLLRYRENIPYREVQEAFKVFYETRDEKIRENLIMRYMPIVKRIIENFEIKEIEEEDLVQMAYEDLIHYIDSYNPYERSVFSSVIRSYLNSKYSHRFSNNLENISLNNLEIYSNSSVEDEVIYQITEEELMNLINKLLNTCKGKSNVEVLKLLYGLDGKILSKGEIANLRNITLQRVSQCENYALKYLYRALENKYSFIPSKLSFQYRKCPTDDFLIYDSYDSLEDSHEVYSRKLK